MIYLDHNSTTPLKSTVVDTMLPFLVEKWGNPSSSYSYGASLKGEIEAARRSVAQLIGGKVSEIFFTSGATESNNTAISSALEALPQKHHIITSAVEHSAVLNCVAFWEEHGYRITRLPVDANGLLDLALLAAAIDNDTAIVSLMWANNETGVLFPIADIAAICKKNDVIFHCDATQGVGKLPINVSSFPVDYLSLSAHKIGGPKGIGALYVRQGTQFTPYLHGGHQERGRRGGTENVSGIMGFGKAAELAKFNLTHYETRVRKLRDNLEDEILSTVPKTELNGDKTQRLPNTTNITFHGIDAEALLLLLDKESICASSGAACLADSEFPSHVIAAMKQGQEVKRQNIRFSLGTENTKDEIRETISVIQTITQQFRR